MSLLKFLTAGKSLVGGRESTARYQVTDPRALPKFESRKNPFRDKVRTERTQTLSNASGPGATPEARSPVGSSNQKVLVDRAASSGRWRAPNKLEPRKATKFRPLSSLRSLADGFAATPSGSVWSNKLSRVTASLSWRRSGKGAEPKARGFGIKGLLFWRRGKTTTIPRLRTPMVQSELSLEGVKVVRNDLSDSDLEIISAKNPAAQVPALPSPAAEKPAPGTTGRRRVNIFGAGKL